MEEREIPLKKRNFNVLLEVNYKRKPTFRTLRSRSCSFTYILSPPLYLVLFFILSHRNKRKRKTFSLFVSVWWVCTPSVLVFKFLLLKLIVTFSISLFESVLRLQRVNIPTEETESICVLYDLRSHRRDTQVKRQISMLNPTLSFLLSLVNNSIKRLQSVFYW